MNSPEYESRENKNENWHVDIEVDQRQSERKSVYEVPLRPQLENDEVRASSWDVLGRVLRGLFDSRGMVRLVGPNERPLERHEFAALPHVLQTQWRNKF